MKLYSLSCRAYFLVVLVSSFLVAYSAPPELQTNDRKDNKPGDQRDGNQANDAVRSKVYLYQIKLKIKKLSLSKIQEIFVGSKDVLEVSLAMALNYTVLGTDNNHEADLVRDVIASNREMLWQELVDQEKKLKQELSPNSSSVPSGKSAKEVVKTSTHKPPPVEVKPLSLDPKVRLYQVEKAIGALSLSKISTILLSTSEDVFPNALADALNYDLNDPKLQVIEDNRETLFRLLWRRLKERPSLPLNPVNNDQNVPTHLEDKNVPDLKLPVEQPINKAIEADNNKAIEADNNKAIEADNKQHDDIIERMALDIKTLKRKETVELLSTESSETIIDAFIAKFKIKDPQYVLELRQLGDERVREVLTKYLSFVDDEDGDGYDDDMTNDDLPPDREDDMDAIGKPNPNPEDEVDKNDETFFKTGPLDGSETGNKKGNAQPDGGGAGNKEGNAQPDGGGAGNKQDDDLDGNTLNEVEEYEDEGSHSFLGAWKFLTLFIVLAVIVVVAYICMHNKKKIREGIGGYVADSNKRRRRAREYQPLNTS